MVEFLNKDTSYAKIVEIVSKADSNLVLITPYIKIPSDLLERLRFMDGKGIKTTVVCREKDLNAEVKSDLKQLKYLDLRFDENLHAKCFHNEKSMVITSLNLYEHSQQNNREMGILLNSTDDVFNEALSEAKFIVGRAKKAQPEFVAEKPKRVISKSTGTITQGRRRESAAAKQKDTTVLGSIVRGVRDVVKEINMEANSPPRHTLRPTKATGKTTTEGFCIRCGQSKGFDLNTPYCGRCYRGWTRYKDPNHWEKYCHACGEFDGETTLNKPLCDSCFTKQKR